MSRRRARSVLITSIVFQSDTANRARLPSRINTPAYICKILVWIVKSKDLAYIAADVAAKENYGKFLDCGGFVSIVKPIFCKGSDVHTNTDLAYCLACII